MKRLILLELLLLLCASLLAQDTTVRKPQTKIEEMSLRQGVVLKKEFNKLGSVNGIDVELLTVSEVNSNQATALRGIRFSVMSRIGSGLSSSTFERHSYIDAEEINGLITFVEFVRQLNTAPSFYTEYVYTTKGDFKAVAYTDTNWSGKLNGEWKLIVYGDKYYSNSGITLSKKQIEEFYNILIKARDLLK